MSMIWLDITTILEWNRPVVGVVRVESECTEYMLNTDRSDIRFCRFDPDTAGFVEVDKLNASSAIDRIRSYETSPLPSPTTPAPTLPVASARSHRIKSIIFAGIHKLPSMVRGPAHRFLSRRKDAFMAAVSAYREAKRSLALMFRPPARYVTPVSIPGDSLNNSVRTPLQFMADDVYVSMGLDWGQKTLGYLYAEKRRRGFKAILFCYDIIPVKRPHLCVGDVAASFARYFTDVAWCADEILCISECSRQDLRELLEKLGAPVPTLSVIKLGCSLPHTDSNSPNADVAEILDQRFILFVSTIERRKNHETLYRAYTRLVDAGRTDLPLLIFVGMPGWGINDLMLDLQLDPHIKPYLRILNHVSDGDLARLYQKAYFTVYPSLYEGWGLPVAESLAYGKFCLASNAASVPEVGGDLIAYLDPWDVPGWTERLQWYFDHPEELERREALIRTRYQPTSWQETGATVLKTATALQKKVPENECEAIQKSFVKRVT